MAGGQSNKNFLNKTVSPVTWNKMPISIINIHISVTFYQSDRHRHAIGERMLLSPWNISGGKQ